MSRDYDPMPGIGEQKQDQEPAKFTVNSLFANAATLQSAFDRPTFPFTITLSSKNAGVSVTLNADGTWDGDLKEFRMAVAAMQGSLGDGGLLIWLLLRQMTRDDERFW